MDHQTTSIRDAPALKSGDWFCGRYRLVKLLGRGGMGVVWQAHDTRLNLDVALKVVPPILATDQSALNHIRREVFLGLNLTHPSIVRIYDFVAVEEHAAVVMELVEGKTLGQLRARLDKKAFDFWQLQPWLNEIFDALIYAHERGQIVHRDLKPSNIMVTTGNHVKIMDFGIAHSLLEASSRITHSNATSFSGTLLYMSPQQLRGEPASVADDIYSIGATLYELLSGRPPFYSGDIFGQINSVPPLDLLQQRRQNGMDDKGCPMAVAQLVARCLSKTVDQRPHSINELAEDFLQFSAIHGPHDQVQRWDEWLKEQFLAEKTVLAETSTPAQSPRHLETALSEPTFGPITLVDFPTIRGLPAPPPPQLSITPARNDFRADTPPASLKDETLPSDATIRRFPAFSLTQESRSTAQKEIDAAPNDDAFSGDRKNAESRTNDAQSRQASRRSASNRQLATQAFEEALASLQQGNLMDVIRCYERAAELGHHGAIGLLESLKDQFPEEHAWETEGNSALETVTLAHGQFLFDVGRNAERGIGQRHDLLKSLSLYRQAAELNHPEALMRLGLLHLHGRGVPKDVIVAASLFARSSEQGHGPAWLQMGRLYEKGMGVQRNHAKSRSCYEQALHLGEDDAAELLSALSQPKPQAKPAPSTSDPTPNVSSPPPSSQKSSSTESRPIFVSYCRKDAQTVHALVNLLRQRGISIWIDVADADGHGGIAAADSWPEEIVKQIERSCLLICMVSSNSMSSKNVQNEVYLAKSHNLRVVPAFLENLEPKKLPYAFQYYFASIQYLPLYRHALDIQAQAQRLYSAVKVLIPAE